MRLGFLVYGGLDRVSGGFLYDRQVVAGLRTLGHTVDVVALPWYSYRRAVAANLLPLPRALERCDLVIEDQLVHPAVFRRHRRLRAAGVPIVSLVHNLACKQPGTALRWLVRRCERAYLAGIDGAIAVSDSTLQDVHSEGGQRLPAVIAYAGRDHLAPAVDQAAVAARAVAPGPLNVVCVGILAPHKGAHRLLAALAGLPDAQIRLDLAGAESDPAYVAKLRRLVARHGLADRVTFHGQLDAAGLSALLARSHLFALASDRESYPISAIEALGAGLPALLTTEGGTAELLGTADCGLLLPPDDIAAWTAALGRLAGDRRRLRALSQGALARYHGHGTWLQTARLVQGLCERVLAQAASSRRAAVGA
jgi:glycosyltransferase involved in cell wall biosynthesis